MIARDKLRIYEQCDGDIDAYARRFRANEQSITDEDWRLIDELLQGLYIVQTGLASASFEARIRAKLHGVAQDGYVCERLFQLAQLKK